LFYSPRAFLFFAVTGEEYSAKGRIYFMILAENRMSKGHIQTQECAWKAARMALLFKKKPHGNHVAWS
jgi:RNase P/RNase MRP subunit POP5